MAKKETFVYMEYDVGIKKQKAAHSVLDKFIQKGVTAVAMKNCGSELLSYCVDRNITITVADNIEGVLEMVDYAVAVYSRYGTSAACKTLIEANKFVMIGYIP